MGGQGIPGASFCVTGGPRINPGPKNGSDEASSRDETQISSNDGNTGSTTKTSAPLFEGAFGATDMSTRQKGPRKAIPTRRPERPPCGTPRPPDPKTTPYRAPDRRDLPPRGRSSLDARWQARKCVAENRSQRNRDVSCKNPPPPSPFTSFSLFCFTFFFFRLEAGQGGATDIGIRHQPGADC